MAFKKTLAISALVTIACLVVRAAPAAAGSGPHDRPGDGAGGGPATAESDP